MTTGNVEPAAGEARARPRRWAGRSLHAGYLRDDDRGAVGAAGEDDCVTVADVVFALARDPFDA